MILYLQQYTSVTTTIFSCRRDCNANIELTALGHRTELCELITVISGYKNDKLQDVARDPDKCVEKSSDFSKLCFSKG